MSCTGEAAHRAFSVPADLDDPDNRAGGIFYRTLDSSPRTIVSPESFLHN
jgi:hypothetical protein